MENAKYYRFELCDDEFEILSFDNDDEAIDVACGRDDVLNVIRLDNELDEVETIF